MPRRLAALAALAALLAPAAPADDHRFPALLERLTDLDALTVPPIPGVKHVQFSSYDRRSDRGPADARAWFANHDAGNFLRVEDAGRGKEYVMAEADGPGVLVRIWSANPRGVLRVYLDHHDQPLLAGPAADLLDGKGKLFPPPLAGVQSRGHNLYVPIPFASHLKVTCSKGRFYYHVNVLTYPKGTPMASLTARGLERSADRIQAAAKRLAARAGPPRPEKRVPWMHFSLPAETGARQTLVRVKRDRAGAGVIRDLQLTGLEAADRAAALRKTLVVMTFDGEETVRVPLAEFFGTGPRAGCFRGLAAGAVKTPEGPLFYCRFPLPFRREADIALENRSGQRIAGKFHARLDPAPLPDSAMHFHAVYRERPGIATRPYRDMNLLDARGRGRVVGCVLTIVNPVKNWWGEGDEKIYVDGETFPSIFGTGSEDYFGYAWCCPKPFSHPYHAQPTCDGPRNYGLTTVNRFHILDPIPFHESVRFDLELWHWKACKVDCMTTTFFYAGPGARDRAPFPAGKTPHYREPGPYTPPRVPGAIEAEELPHEAPSGTIGIQRGVLDWSHDAQLWWQDPRVGGGPLVITFDAPAAGRYKVLARFTAARDYGRFRITVNRSRTAFEHDFYAPRLRLSGELVIGTFPLRAKGNRMAIACVGRHPKAADRRMLGIDYLKLVRVDDGR